MTREYEWVDRDLVEEAKDAYRFGPDEEAKNDAFYTCALCGLDVNETWARVLDDDETYPRRPNAGHVHEECEEREGRK